MTEGSKKLLWIGWDGADWEHIKPLLDEGLLPNLEKLINEGVMGNLATLQPVLRPCSGIPPPRVNTHTNMESMVLRNPIIKTVALVRLAVTPGNPKSLEHPVATGNEK